MGRDARTILADALMLGDEERAAFATELIASLDEPAAESQEEIDRLWAIEIERRSHRLRSGELPGIPWQQVRAGIERRLASTATPVVPESADGEDNSEITRRR